MGDLLWILMSAMVVNNFTLFYFLGLCPFMGVSARVETAVRMGMANIFVLTITAICAWFLNTYILPVAPYLRLISFIVVIASLVQIVEMTIKKVSPVLFRQLGIYLPLITTNCAVMGIALIAVRSNYSASESFVAGFAAGAGFLLAIVVMSSIREKLDTEWVPKPFRGVPIAFVTAGLMALAFMAFDNALLKNLLG